MVYFIGEHRKKKVAYLSNLLLEFAQILRWNR